MVLISNLQLGMTQMLVTSVLNRTETNRSWEFTGWVSFTFSERPYLRNRQRMRESKIRFLSSSPVCLVVDIDKHTLEFKERTWVVT